MPQLEKGGKWVFGWVIVDADMRIRIPQEAWSEYRFETEQEAIFLKGSITSGGFAIGTKGRIPDILTARSLGTGQFRSGKVVQIPRDIDVAPWQKLLAVRGSGHALNFLTKGTIYEMALRHPAMTQTLA